MKKSAVVMLVGIASLAAGAAALWIAMPPLGYDWAPQALTDWQRIRTAEALVRRQLSDPGAAEFNNARISDKTLYGVRKSGTDPDEANFFAVCGELSEATAAGGSTSPRKFVVLFDARGGRANASVEPRGTGLEEQGPLFENAMRPCR